jgi:hypothetical protein
MHLLICRNNCANHRPPIFLKEMLCKFHRRLVFVDVQHASTWSGELCLVHQPVTSIDCSAVCLLVFVPTVNLKRQHNSRDCTTYTEDIDAMFDGFCRHVLYECNARPQYLIIDSFIVMSLLAVHTFRSPFPVASNGYLTLNNG